MQVGAKTRRVNSLMPRSFYVLSVVAAMSGCAAVPASELGLKKIAATRPQADPGLTQAARLSVPGDRMLAFIPGINLYHTLFTAGYALQDGDGNRYYAVDVAREMDAVGLTLTAQQVRRGRFWGGVVAPWTGVAMVTGFGVAMASKVPELQAAGAVATWAGMVAIPILEYVSSRRIVQPALNEHRRWLQQSSEQAGEGRKAVVADVWVTAVQGVPGLAIRTRF